MFCLAVGMFASCVHVPVAGSHLQTSFRNAPRSLPPPYTNTAVPFVVPPALYLSAGPVVPVAHGPGVPPLGVQVADADAVAVAVAVEVAVAAPVAVAVGVFVGVPDGVPQAPVL